MFIYSDDYLQNIREIDGIVFCCEEIKPVYDAAAEHLASVYFERLPSIVDGMISDLVELYGETIKTITRDEVIEKLGQPLIDLELNIINYPNQTFDDEHILSVEYYGDFEQISNFSVDG